MIVVWDIAPGIAQNVNVLFQEKIVHILVIPVGAFMNTHRIVEAEYVVINENSQQVYQRHIKIPQPDQRVISGGFAFTQQL